MNKSGKWTMWDWSPGDLVMITSRGARTEAGLSLGWEDSPVLLVTEANDQSITVLSPTTQRRATIWRGAWGRCSTDWPYLTLHRGDGWKTSILADELRVVVRKAP
jgi:hypothetical protein